MWLGSHHIPIGLVPLIKRMFRCALVLPLLPLRWHRLPRQTQLPLSYGALYRGRVTHHLCKRPSYTLRACQSPYPRRPFLLDLLDPSQRLAFSLQLHLTVASCHVPHRESRDRLRRLPIPHPSPPRPTRPGQAGQPRPSVSCYPRTYHQSHFADYGL